MTRPMTLLGILQDNHEHCTIFLVLAFFSASLMGVLPALVISSMTVHVQVEIYANAFRNRR